MVNKFQVLKLRVERAMIHDSAGLWQRYSIASSVGASQIQGSGVQFWAPCTWGFLRPQGSLVFFTSQNHMDWWISVYVLSCNWLLPSSVYSGIATSVSAVGRQTYCLLLDCSFCSSIHSFIHSSIVSALFWSLNLKPIPVTHEAEIHPGYNHWTRSPLQDTFTHSFITIHDLHIFGKWDKNRRRKPICGTSAQTSWG